jgi:hypothetical protein
MIQETLSDYLAVEKLKGTPNKTVVKKLSGRVWPTGEFSFGTYAERPDDRLDDREITYWGGDEPAPFDSTNLPNSHITPQCPLSAGSEGTKKESKKRGKYGKKGITGYGKKMLKSGGKLLQDSTRNYRLTFGTVTLPPLTPDQRKSVSEGWGKLLNRLIQFLGRGLEQQGLPKAILAATEVQPGRLRETTEAYLHVHLVWPNHQDRRKGWAVDPNKVRAWLISYLEKHHGVEGIAYININTQQVRANAAGYLAKYLSKGQEEIQAVIDDVGLEGLPGQWWSMTKLLKEWVWLAMQAGPAVGERVEQWLNYAWDYDNFELFRYIYHVEIPINGAPVTVGWRGCLSPKGLELWRGMSGDLAIPLAQ